ncbi:hypothetical protein DPMN_105448 [Dreissena polymorpha]|uniref:Uncharacterized protein n=1 Tax=Dreissena polymorpha TaxID=45954 RepID=A0A9D4HDD2_DREPO|nr:hypothetical protein DPMN_105448 [Dreissena polymorpha]
MFEFAHLRGFHDDWAQIVISRVHVIQLTGTIFKLNSHIKETNVLTKFHENWANNVPSRVFTYKYPAHWRPYINQTNVLTNFHDDWAKSVTSRVFTSHVIQRTGTIFELHSHIKETNGLTKLYENLANNVTSRVEKCPAHWRPCFSPIWTIFELVRDINKTNVLTNFYDDWAKIVTSRVFTRKTAPPPGSHVIQLTGTIFKLNSHIKETNVLTKFHENWAKNVTSRVFTCFHYIHIEKNAPPTGGHVFSPIGTILELVRDINKTNRELKTALPGSHETNVLTKFHENWAKNVTSRREKNAPPTGGHVFSPIWTIFELPKRKTAPPTGGHVFQRTRTTFELDHHIIKANILTNFELGRDFIGAKLLTKFHEYPT